MNDHLLIGLALFGLVVTIVAGLGAKNLRHFSHRRIEVLSRAWRRRDVFDEIIELHDDAADSAEKLRALGIVVLVYSTALFGATVYRDDWQAVLLIAVGVAAVVLAATVWIPWAVVRYLSAPFLMYTWWFWKWNHRLFWPFRWAGTVFDFFFRRLADLPKVSDREQEEEDFEDEIISMASAGWRDGLLEDDALEMIEGVIELGDADVGDILTPRSQVDAMDANLDWNETVEFAHRVGRTRIPVYERTLDDIVGVLYVKDMLPELVKPVHERCPVRELLREPWRIPSTVPLDDLLQDFLENRKHLAIVVDEYDAVEGVVTIEDVLEEIVGEIVDEYDTDAEEEIKLTGEKQADVLGTVHLDTVNEELGLELPHVDDVDTVAGFVLAQLGRIPKKGVSVRHGDSCITVTEANKRGILRVRIELDVEDEG